MENLDTSDAYAVGIGSWDKICVRYAYIDANDDQTLNTELAAIVDEAITEHRFLSDSDARSANASHPLANLWDNGSDPIAELRNVLEVRRIGLNRFGEDRIARARPMSELHEALVPLYFFHRYQLDAVGKYVGGVNYTFALRGDGQTPVEPVDADAQRAALAILLECIRPDVLLLSDQILDLVPPRHFGARSTEELFTGATDPAFDPLAAARSAADLAIQQILQPQRCARIIEQHRRNARYQSLDEVLAAVTADRSDPNWTTGEQELDRAVQSVVVDRLIGLARSSQSTAAVRGRVEFALMDLLMRYRQQMAGGDSVVAHAAVMHSTIERYLNRSTDLPLDDDSAEPAPPGSPIGMFDLGRCSCCQW